MTERAKLVCLGNDDGYLSSDLYTRVMGPILPCTLRRDSQITGRDEKIVSISHQKLEQPFHGTILSMMLTVIMMIGLFPSVKLLYSLVMKHYSVMEARIAVKNN